MLTIARDQLNRLVRWIPTWCLYVLGALPAPWLFYLGVTGGLGVDPVKAIEHRYGELALQFLIASLSITPLRRYLGLNLMKFRRAIGLLCFFYVCCHLLVWLVLDVQILSQIVTDILKRPFVTIGMGSFLLLLPLAVTSNTASIRKLGSRWRKLHRLVYPAAVLGGVHYVWLAKGFQIEPLAYLCGIAVLLLLRMPLVDLVKRRLSPAQTL
ncbi:protein-methionine-sulfoxide reductase heme-binding subunit MsrQ [Epibacterium sp. SM1979]|uniref:Protein-methionine-sulfoxide reductase heme-binding subunit MsrQ n=1 Tax=Tritonibacter litoralis TaxID=2662264 RepID=A0A843YH03_9RHOB|nr:protein-methionine-sulfoxide reductase heme-binding subunit MsrQ [Tritonibacter litoralis]MQQ08047.1 protein-methionine-sulfoxide reductase heme-binding subunit MsrQ [Tritonibacter litoralis]